MLMVGAGGRQQVCGSGRCHTCSLPQVTLTIFNQLANLPRLWAEDELSVSNTHLSMFSKTYFNKSFNMFSFLFDWHCKYRYTQMKIPIYVNMKYIKRYLYYRMRTYAKIWTPSFFHQGDWHPFSGSLREIWLTCFPVVSRSSGDQCQERVTWARGRVRVRVRRSCSAWCGHLQWWIQRDILCRTRPPPPAPAPAGRVSLRRTRAPFPAGARKRVTIT